MSIHFKEEKELNLPLQYPERSNSLNLKKLRETYNLDDLLDKRKSDFENIINIQSWVHSRWEHDSEQIADKSDPLHILEQAEKGKRFRCAEYSTVSKACLQALGFTVRELCLRSRDPELIKRKASHVMNEIYLKDLKKWFFMDPCFDIMIKKNGIPLNAVELLLALINGDELEVINPSNEITCEEYLEIIGPFLYYFSVDINSSNNNRIWDRITRNKSKLVLTPVADDAPKYFRKYSVRKNYILTNSIADFYPTL